MKFAGCDVLYRFAKSRFSKAPSENVCRDPSLISGGRIASGRIRCSRHGYLAAVLLYVACILLATILSRYVVSVKATNAYNPDNLIRLHVIADTESYEDRVVKYKVRDAILKSVSDVLAGASTKDEATRLLLAQVPSIEEACEREVERSGRRYGIDIDLIEARLPKRSYGPIELPDGRYCTMRVTLGRGLGSNWWCVLFPPLCFVDIATSGGVDGTRQGIRSIDIADISEISLIEGYLSQDAMTSEGRVLLVLGDQGEPLVRTEIRFALLDALSRLILHGVSVATKSPQPAVSKP